MLALWYRKGREEPGLPLAVVARGAFGLTGLLRAMNLKQHNYCSASNTSVQALC